jgi:hypothetical protein
MKSEMLLSSVHSVHHFWIEDSLVPATRAPDGCHKHGTPGDMESRWREVGCWRRQNSGCPSLFLREMLADTFCSNQLKILQIVLFSIAASLWAWAAGCWTLASSNGGSNEFMRKIRSASSISTSFTAEMTIFFRLRMNEEKKICQY